MSIKAISLQSPIEKKIAWAEEVHHRLRHTLLQDPKVAQLLKNLRGAVQDSRREMVRAGIVDACTDCEEREGGSCCGAGVENYYSGLLLLINLLLDVNLPTERHDPASCFFLGRDGCQLLARHVLCVNFLCKKITDRIDPHKINALRQKEGVELECLFLSKEQLQKLLMRLPES
jgi:hypothetical protein